MKIKKTDFDVSAIVSERTVENTDGFRAVYEFVQKNNGIGRPIGIDESATLIWGHNELGVARRLEWDTIPTVIVSIASLLKGGIVSGEMRRTFTVAERVAIGIAIEKRIGGRKDNRGELVQSFLGQRTTAVAARLTELGGHTRYNKIKQILTHGSEFDRIDIEFDELLKPGGTNFEQENPYATQLFPPKIEPEIALVSLPVGSVNIVYNFRGRCGDIWPIPQEFLDAKIIPPLTIDSDNNLIWGHQYLKEIRKRGQSHANCKVVDLDALLADNSEGAKMQDEFTVSERVAIAIAIEDKIGGYGNKERRAVVAPEYDGWRVDDIAAAKTGFGKKSSYRRVKKMVVNGTPHSNRSLLD